jgi:hypothetical protein
VKRHFVAALGLGLTAALGAMSGCGTESAPRVGEEAAAIEAAAPRPPISPVNTELDHYFRVRRDFRWCLPRGPCSGLYLWAVNTGEPAGLVASLDFSQTGFDDRLIADVEGADHRDVILYGTLLNPTEAGEPRPFVVKAAYRGMPRVAASAGEAFYRVEQRSPPRFCITAPCNNEIAARLETAEQEDFTTLDVDRAGSQPLVDRSWIANRVALHGALVAGRLRDGRAPARPERLSSPAPRLRARSSRRLHARRRPLPGVRRLRGGPGHLPAPAHVHVRPGLRHGQLAGGQRRLLRHGV